MIETATPKSKPPVIPTMISGHLNTAKKAARKNSMSGTLLNLSSQFTDLIAEVIYLLLELKPLFSPTPLFNLMGFLLPLLFFSGDFRIS